MRTNFLNLTLLRLNKVLVIAILFIYLILSIIPFIIFGNHPLGYDTGFYRRYLINPNISIPNAPVPGLDHTIIAPRIFLDIIRFFRLNTDISLYGSYILLNLFFVLVFYFFIREYSNKKIALIALTLLVFSPIQYTGYWFMLYKNFFGLIFFFLFFLFLKKKRFLLSLLSALIVPLSHQTTTILLLTTLGFYILITLLFKKRFLISELIILTLVLFTYLYLHPNVQQKFDAPPVGVFIEKIYFIIIALPLIVLTIIGFPKFLNILKQNLLPAAFGGISIIFPLLSLPYYQRIFLFTNYWLIFGAAVGTYNLLKFHTLNKKKYYKPIIIVAVLLIFHVSFLIYQIFKLKPLINQEHIIEINKLKESIPTNASILTSTRLTPWVQGWTTAKVYAPGILKDKHPSWEWQSYWEGSSKEKISFLSTFPKPVYIFIDESQNNLFIPKIPCVKKITKMLYVNKCEEKLNN